MSISANAVARIDALDEVIDRYDLSTSDYCIVGSAALAARDLRENGDLDICFAPAIGDAVDLTPFEGVEPAPNKYEPIGISDEELISDPQYHDVVDGYKIVRPEIEYSHKMVRQWDKDRADIDLIEQYRDETEDWNSDLVVEGYRPGFSHLVRRGVCSLRENGVRETIHHGVTYLRWHGPLPRREPNYSGQPTTIPGKALMSLRQDGIRTTLGRGVRLVKLKEPTGLLDRYSNLRHKAKVGTLIDHRLELHYPTGELFLEQYNGETFTRMDLVVWLLAAEAMLDDDSVPEIVDEFETHAEVDVQDRLSEHVDRYERDPVPPTVPVSYDSSVLDPAAFAIAVIDDPESIPVQLKSGTSSVSCSRSWFERVNVSDAALEHLDQRYTELLYDSNALFPFILWPPAQDHVEDILAQIRSEKTVHFTREIQLEDDETFGEFVRALYESQADLNPDHIDAKIEAMADYPKVVTVGALEVPNPRIREGFSNEMIQFKERVREQFTPKILSDNPSANLLIHATDNFDHNRETWDVINMYGVDRREDNVELQPKS